MSGVGTRGPYAKTAAIQRRILDAALAVFAERGYHSTTMKEVASRAEISERGLVHHFAAKEDLLSAVLQHQESLREPLLMDASAAPGQAVFDVVADNANHPELVELHTVLSAEATSRDHPAHGYYVQRYAEFRGYLAGQFRSLVDSSVDPDDLAAMFIAMLDGLQVQWLYDNDSVEIPRLMRRFMEMARLTEPATR